VALVTYPPKRNIPDHLDEPHAGKCARNQRSRLPTLPERAPQAPDKPGLLR